MKFELRRVRTAHKSGEKNSIVGRAKAILLLGEKPNYTRIELETSSTASAAELRGGVSASSTEVSALKKLMERAAEEHRNFEESKAQKN